MRDLFSNQHRALYQFGGFHELSQITEDEWHEGLGERFAQDECTFDEEALSASSPRARDTRGRRC